MYKSNSSIWQRWVTIIFAAAVVFQLTGCDSAEKKQSAALIVFLQSDVMNKQKIHVPALTEEQKKEFGPYVKDYVVLTGFHDQLRQTFFPIGGAVKALYSLSDLKAMLADRQLLVDAIANIEKANTLLANVTKTTEEAHVALKQPEELKKVYDQAYERVVTKEADAAKEALPLLKDVFASALELVNFIQSKSATSTIVNNIVEFSDPADVDTFNNLNGVLQANYQKYSTWVDKKAGNY